MTTVYLHIGAPKTATSAIQSILAGNQSHLMDRRVLYPSSMRSGDAHHLLVCDLIEKYQGKPMPDIWYGSHPRGVAWDALKEEMASCEGAVDSVILSSELFFGQANNFRPALEEIAAHLAGYEVRIVAYLRRQDQLYSSFYNQDVKGVRQWCASAYEFYETHQMLRHDYLALIRPWSDIFGKEQVILRPFESVQWPNGDLVAEYSATFGGLELKTQVPTENNEGLGPAQLYLKRCLNRVGYDKQENETVVAILKELIHESPVGNCQFVNRGLYRRYLDRWERVNEKLSNEFLGGKALFDRPIPHPQDVELYEFDRFTLALAINHILRLFEKGAYPEQRSLFFRAAFLAISEQNLWRSLDKNDRQTLLDGV
ncbi:MAG: hypothetical protein Hals2KO_30280 [Halioglobus sp.]